MKYILIEITFASLVILAIYGFYYSGKETNYHMFYEDMVVETIFKNVKSDCLKK